MASKHDAASRTPASPWDTQLTAPVLCRARVGLTRVLLGPHPSLPNLRDPAAVGRPPLFGWFIGTTVRSDSSTSCAPDVRLNAFSGRPAALPSGDAEVSRFSCMKFLSACAGSTTTQGPQQTRAFACCAMAFPLCPRGRRPGLVFRSSIPGPSNASVYASRSASRQTAQDSRSRWFATPFLSFSCKTLSFSTSCRFIPAHGQ